LANGKPLEYTDKWKAIADKYRFQIYEEPIIEILGNPKEGLKGFKLKGGKRVESTKSVVALGIRSHNKLLLDVGGKVDDRGKAIVNNRFESSVPNFFVVGDLVAGPKMQIYTAWDQAVDAADEINSRLRRSRRTTHSL